MAASTDQAERPRRFYKTVDLRAEGGGFAVALDGRIAKTAGGAPLIVPSEALGRLLAAEWAAQETVIDFTRMPATRLAFTAIDRTSVHHEEVAQEIARFSETDLLCYFAEGPEGLIQRQEALWGPWLAWAERELGLVLIRARGVTHQTQPPETPARGRALAAGLDDFTLSGLAFASALYGSVVLGFAAQRRALSGLDAFDLSRLDEAFQEERWGIDAEAAARTAKLSQEASMVGDWFAALAPTQTV